LSFVSSFIGCDRGCIVDIIDRHCSGFFLHLGICTFLSFLAPLLSSHTSLGTQPTLIPTPFLIPSPSPSGYAGFSPWEGSRHPICSHDVDVSSKILHSNFKSVVRSKQKEKEAQKSEEVPWLTLTPSHAHLAPSSTPHTTRVSRTNSHSTSPAFVVYLAVPILAALRPSPRRLCRLHQASSTHPFRPVYLLWLWLGSGDSRSKLSRLG